MSFVSRNQNQGLVNLLMNKLNILMIVPNLGATNGVTTFTMTYYRQLDHNRIHIDFALICDIGSPYYKEIRDAGGNIFTLPPVIDIVKHKQQCQKIIHDGHYDIIVDNSLILTLPMMICAKKNEIPVRILHSHNTRLSSNLLKSRIERIGLPLLKNQCTDFCACGRDAGKFLFGKKKFTVIPNVISPDVNKYDTDLRSEIKLKMGVSDRIVIGTVGRTSPQKNPYFAIKVIESLAQKIPNLTYWWIGSGEMDEELKDYVKAKGLDQIILFWGSRNDVSDFYQAMDIFFLPSLFEGLPVTGVEAQAFGLPSVVSDTITDEMVYRDLVKYVSLQDSIDAWGVALEELIKRIPERRSYTEELKQSKFSAEGAGERLEKLYREMLSRNMK